MDRRGFLLTSAAGLLATLHSGPSLAQDGSGARGYPTKSVRVIVPFAAGGATDLLGRLAAQILTEKIGQPFVVENITGAGGTIGATLAAKSPPDGHTLLVGTLGTMAVNPQIQADIAYHPLQAFRAAALIGDTPGMLMVRRESPYATLADLIADARKRPGALSFGSAGIGSFSHLSGELFAMRAGIKVVHVPYRGTAPATVDLLAGTIDFISGATLTYLSARDRLRGLVVGANQRSELAPEVPNATEAGVPEYLSTSWTGLFAPAATPTAIVEIVSRAIAAGLSEESVKKKYIDMGAEPPRSLVTDEFGKYVANEYDSIGKIVKSANLK